MAANVSRAPGRWVALAATPRSVPRTAPAFAPAPHLCGSSPTLRRVTFPAVPLGVTVELALGADQNATPQSWTWTDVTGYVLIRDEVTIHRGRLDEQTQSQPSTCVVTLDNSDGRFTPRNPTGSYFGRFGRNTPLRVRVNAGTGVHTRFTGYVSEWPPRWDPSGRDNWVTVTASGVLRRLVQGQQPARSPVVAEVLHESGSGTLWGYWPLEDGPQATVGAPAYGSVVLTASGVTFAGESAPAGSAWLPGLSGGGSLRSATSLPAVGADEWRVEFLQLVDSGAGVTHTPVSWSTSGDVASWRVRNTTSGKVVLEAFSVTGTELLGGTVAASVNVFNGRWCYVTVAATAAGADILVTVTVEDVTAGTASYGSGVVTGRGIGDVRTVAVNPASAGAGSGLRSVGHLSCSSRAPVTSRLSALSGYDGWPAALRFAGICAHAGIAYDPGTVFADSVAMGPQPRDPVVALLREVENADRGQIVERRTGELGYDPRTARENQPVALALDYLAGEIAVPLEPVDDDRLVRNDVTVTRPGGAPAQVVRAGGALGTARVGDYDDQVTANLYADSQSALLAGWLVNQGTVDEYRFPRVNLNLHRSPTVIAAWLAADIGSRLTIHGLPAGVCPDPADQILEGYTERLTAHTWRVELNCAPFQPWRVATLAGAAGDTGPFLGYLVPDSCALAAEVTAGASTVPVMTTPLWSVAVDDYTPGIPIVVDGERMTVIGCSGTSNPQTLTVTRAVNGVVAAHPVGATVVLADPGVLGL